MAYEIKILLADDHRLFLEGIRSIIESEPGLKVVAEANDGEEVMVKLKSYYVDIVMLDIQMPKMNGIQAAQMISEKYPDIRVLVLSMHTEKIFIEKMYTAGVAGYVLKNTNKEELINAIRTVHRGGRYFSNDIIPALFDNSSSKTVSKSMFTPELTKREREILTLIAREYSNPQIAEELFISIQTVNTHRKNLLKKLDAKNTAGLVKYAISINLLQ